MIYFKLKSAGVARAVSGVGVVTTPDEVYRAITPKGIADATEAVRAGHLVEVTKSEWEKQNTQPKVSAKPKTNPKK